MNFVATTLGSEHPRVAVPKIQARAALGQPLCAPLLGMLDKLGVSRADAHRAVLTMAKQVVHASSCLVALSPVHGRVCVCIAWCLYIRGLSKADALGGDTI